MGLLPLLLEAERRGILPAEKQTLLVEARRRGLVGASQPTDAGVGSPPAPSSAAAPQGVRGDQRPRPQPDLAGLRARGPEALEQLQDLSRQALPQRGTSQPDIPTPVPEGPPEFGIPVTARTLPTVNRTDRSRSILPGMETEAVDYASALCHQKISSEETVGRDFSGVKKGRLHLRREAPSPPPPPEGSALGEAARNFFPSLGRLAKDLTAPIPGLGMLAGNSWDSPIVVAKGVWGMATDITKLMPGGESPDNLKAVAEFPEAALREPRRDREHVPYGPRGDGGRPRRDSSWRVDHRPQDCGHSWEGRPDRSCRPNCWSCARRPEPPGSRQRRSCSTPHPERWPDRQHGDGRGNRISSKGHANRVRRRPSTWGRRKTAPSRYPRAAPMEMLLQTSSSVR